MNYCQTLSIELIKAIPFLIIGGITAYIAYRQYKIEKSRIQATRFEYRSNILKAVDNIRQAIIFKNKITGTHYQHLHNDISHREAFFSKKLSDEMHKLELSVYTYYTATMNSGKEKKIEIERKAIITHSKDILKKGYTESTLI